MLVRTKAVNIWGVVADGEMKNARIPKSIQIQFLKNPCWAKEAHLQVTVASGCRFVPLIYGVLPEWLLTGQARHCAELQV